MALFVFVRRLAQTGAPDLPQGFPPNAEFPTTDRHPMSPVDGYFDRSGRVQPPPYGRLWREAGSFIFEYPKAPKPSEFKPGEGHVVLVIPGFLTPDMNTFPLRRFLTGCGYRAFGWGMNVNFGPTPRLLAGLERRFQECRAIAGAPISVIGVSLGGLFARNLAFDHPRDVRQVITLVSPYRLPTASTIEPLVRLCAPFFSEAIDIRRLATQLPVPSTAVYTREDGLVAWETCWTEEANGQSVEVKGKHVTICRNPATLRTVGRRLAEVRG
jgi:pimeloyl-ACP methyl ester carboxylesterase